METTHKILFGNAQNMKEIGDGTIHLVITSPPYPMIGMWDELFTKQNSAIADALEKDEGNLAFELIHKELDKVWTEIYRVLRDGGIVCINIGDATRKVGDEFRQYPNHSRILQFCLSLGLTVLPEILWRKQTNAPNKFMGSGMLPPGAYVTLEHEHILIFRKGNKRAFRQEEEKILRRESAYFWEERNEWFSDIWEGLKGTSQKSIEGKIRERSGAYPFELAYRLINMFSLREDTVLDPFLGTGTTTMAAMVTGRNSVGIELDSNFNGLLKEKFNDIVLFSHGILENRIFNHINFVQEKTEEKNGLKYKNKIYDFPVMTSQETDLIFDEPKKIHQKENTYIVEYREEPSFKYIDGTLVQLGSLKEWLKEE